MSDSKDPAKMTVPNVAKFLTHVGEKPVTVEQVEKDLAAGAPTNADGTINLVAYGAWLVRETLDKRQP